MVFGWSWWLSGSFRVVAIGLAFKFGFDGTLPTFIPTSGFLNFLDGVGF